MLPVEVPHINQLYHVSWAKSGCVWRLVKINGDGTCIMKTPKTHKEITANIKDLRHTRAMEYKITNKIDNYFIHLNQLQN